MRLFKIALTSDFGSRARMVLSVAAPDASTAIEKAIAHYGRVNNGVDCRVESVTDGGPILL